MNVNFEIEKIIKYRQYYIDDIEEIKNQINKYCENKKVSDCLEYIESKQKTIKEIQIIIDKINFTLQFLNNHLGE